MIGWGVSGTRNLVIGLLANYALRLLAALVRGRDVHLSKCGGVAWRGEAARITRARERDTEIGNWKLELGLDREYIR